MIRLFIMVVVIFQQAYGDDAGSIRDKFRTTEKDEFKTQLASDEETQVLDAYRKVHSTTIQFLKETDIFVDNNDFIQYSNWYYEVNNVIGEIGTNYKGQDNEQLEAKLEDLARLRYWHRSIYDFVHEHKKGKSKRITKQLQFTFSDSLQDKLSRLQTKNYTLLCDETCIKDIRSQLMIQELLSKCINLQALEAANGPLKTEKHQLLDHIHKKWGYPFGPKSLNHDPQLEPEKKNRAVLLYKVYEFSNALKNALKSESGKGEETIGRYRSTLDTYEENMKYREKKIEISENNTVVKNILDKCEEMIKSIQSKSNCEHYITDKYKAEALEGGVLYTIRGSKNCQGLDREIFDNIIKNVRERRRRDCRTYIKKQCELHKYWTVDQNRTKNCQGLAENTIKSIFKEVKEENEAKFESTTSGSKQKRKGDSDDDAYDDN